MRKTTFYLLYALIEKIKTYFGNFGGIIMKKALICSKNSYFSAYANHLFTPQGVSLEYISTLEELKSMISDNEFLFVIFDTCIADELSIKLIQQFKCPLIILDSLQSNALTDNSSTAPLVELFKSSLSKKENLKPLSDSTFFDIGKHCIWKKEEYIPLATQEFKILYFLHLNANKVVSSEDLINYADLTSRSSLYVHINSLREKVEENPGDPKIILTKFGKGYQIQYLANNCEVFQAEKVI